MARVFLIIIIVYISGFFECLKGSNSEQLEWLSDLRNYIKTIADEYQVMIINSANQTESVDNPSIRNLLISTIESRPTLRLSLNRSSKTSQNKLYDEISDTAGTFFILIRDHKFTDIKSLMNMIDVLKELSLTKEITKFLLISLSMESNETFEIIFQYTWKKQIVDITILEIPNCDIKINTILKDCSEKIPTIHQFNPFLNLFKHELYSSETQWFPIIMKNLYGYPIKVALVNDPPFSLVRYNEKLQVKSMSGPDILVMKALESKMNFTAKILPHLIGYEEIRNGSIDGLFKLLESDKIDLIAHVNPHYTEDITENAYRTGVLFVDELCALVPIEKEIKVPLSLSALEAIIISTTIVISFWIPAFLLNFDRSCWSIFVIFRVLFGISVNKRPLITSQRILYTFLMVISFSYSSNIYASLTSVSIDTDREIEYRNFDDLAKSSLTPIISKYLYEKTFSESEGAILELKNKVKNTTNIWRCPFKAERNKNITCLMGKLESEIYLSLKKSKKQTLKLSKVCFWSDSYTFLLRKGSPLRRAFKNIFLIFSAVGLHSKWYKKHAEMELSEDIIENTVEELLIPTKTLLEQLAAILLFGYIASGIAFIGEIIYNKILNNWKIKSYKFYNCKIVENNFT
ncbi:uncharacterized protein LOC130666372 [Microplitis mediator]|uniref:uncharacterized protein LOC130666372 n=1 Tax=Microplitis mediator TaxID=375433 RepID=UPI002552BCF8|nr:uncharacterized protein LOC130666372 [Microplitis mediator]